MPQTAEHLLLTHNGSCSADPVRLPGDGSLDNYGAWPLSPAQAVRWSTATQLCVRRCSYCARCSTISVSLEERTCSWHSDCSLDALYGSPQHFRSGNVGRLHDKRTLPHAHPHVAEPRGAIRSATVPAVNVEHRGALVTLLNQLKLTGEALEVGCFRGAFSRHNLQLWHGHTYHMVDAWAFRANDTAGKGAPISGDKNPRFPWMHLSNYRGEAMCPSRGNARAPCLALRPSCLTLMGGWLNSPRTRC